MLRTLSITASNVLQDLDMTGYLFTRTDRASLTPDIIADKLITTAWLSVDYNLLSTELRY